MVMWDRRSACGVTRRVMPIRLEPCDDRGGVVALHAVAPRGEQHGSVGPPGQGFGDRLLGAGVEGDLRWLVTLAEDPQGRLVAGALQIAGVGVLAAGGICSTPA